MLLCTPKRLFFNLLLGNSVAVDCCCVELTVFKGVLFLIPSLWTDFVCTLSRGCVAKLPFPRLLGKEFGKGELIDVSTFSLTGALLGLILVTPGCPLVGEACTDLCCTLGFTVFGSGLLGEALLADLY